MTRPVFQNPHLDGSSFTLTAGSTGILLLHGFTATTVEVRPLAEFLHAQGYSVSAPLLPGHGTRPEDMFRIQWMQWVNTAEDALLKLIKVSPRLFLAGESMGGLLSLYLAARYRDICGVILYAPAIKIKNIWQACLLAPFKKIMPKKYLKDENGAVQDALPWQGYNVLPIPAVCQLSKLQKVVRSELPAVTQPTLIFQGKKDTTIDPDGANEIYSAISSVDKELILLENSGHCVVLDVDLEQIQKLTLDFIRRIE